MPRFSVPCASRTHRVAREGAKNFVRGGHAPDVLRHCHERANATAEVRRSFNRSYPPLYQIACMMGALQFRALRKELVDSGKMTNREFHDSILKGGRIPVEMVRAMLTEQPPARDYTPHWKFAGEVSGKP